MFKERKKEKEISAEFSGLKSHRFSHRGQFLTLWSDQYYQEKKIFLMINLVQDTSFQCDRKGHSVSSYCLIEFSGITYFLKQEKLVKMIHGPYLGHL